MTDSGWLTEAEFQAVGRHLDELVQEFEALPFPQVRERVFDLLQTVDALHRAGLGRLLGFLRDQDGGALVERAAEDPVVETLLALYDLLPADPRAQVETALESVRPYMSSHGGGVEVLDIVDGVVHLRLAGSCDGCAASALTLKRGVETALREGFPGFAGIRVHEPAPVPVPAPKAPMSGFIPLQQVGPKPVRAPRRPVFAEVARLDEVPPGTMREVEVAGSRVLVFNVAGEVYAVDGSCPGSMAPLGLGSFTPPIIVCPWHNDAFDVRTGKRVDGSSGPPLRVLPIALEAGTIKVAVTTAPADGAAERRP